jgi:pyrroline-5-carboxylate reductase
MANTKTTAGKISTVGVIGLGTMGRCMVRGLIDSSAVSKSSIYFTTKHGEASSKAGRELGIAAVGSNQDLVKKASLIVIAVKPQNISEVLADIRSSVTPQHTVLSIVASVQTEQIEASLRKGVAVVRAMPNTPALVREGMTAICLGANASEMHGELARMVFSPLGQVVRVDEKHMDAVTGLSGCGPAYVYVVLESLTDAGIKVGLSREVAQQLACQTVLGAAKMLMETGKHPAALKDEVTTPAGCTIDGLMELEEGKLRVTLIKAVVQATKRAKSLRIPE